MATSIGHFSQLIIIKGAILGLYASNPISSNSLRPILTNFRIFTILSLSATLTQFETSVPPPPLAYRSSKKILICLGLIVFSYIFCCHFTLIRPRGNSNIPPTTNSSIASRGFMLGQQFFWTSSLKTFFEPIRSVFEPS